MPQLTIADLGEDRLLERVGRLIDAPAEGMVGLGDDAAILPVKNGRQLLTTDVLVENTHFRRDWCTPEEVGWKALAVNLSDIAGMGGRPVAALVSLILPADTPVNAVLGFYRGMRPLARTAGVSILGGNLSRGSCLSLSLALIGEDTQGRAVLRSGARPGDRLFVSGEPGLARLGLMILSRKMPKAPNAWTEPRTRLFRRRREAAQAYPEGSAAVRRFLLPEPRLDWAHDVKALLPTAMMDLSDGLAADLPRLALASGVGLVIEAPVPSPEFLDLCAGLHVSPEDAVLGGGEDYELLMTLPAGTAAPPGTWRAIGEVTREKTVLLRDAKGRTRPLRARGFDHFKTAR